MTAITSNSMKTGLGYTLASTCNYGLLRRIVCFESCHAFACGFPLDGMQTSRNKCHSHSPWSCQIEDCKKNEHYCSGTKGHSLHCTSSRNQKIISGWSGKEECNAYKEFREKIVKETMKKDPPKYMTLGEGSFILVKIFS